MSDLKIKKKDIHLQLTLDQVERLDSIAKKEGVTRRRLIEFLIEKHLKELHKTPHE